MILPSEPQGNITYYIALAVPLIYVIGGIQSYITFVHVSVGWQLHYDHEITTYGEAEIGTMAWKLSCYSLFNYIQLCSLSTLNEVFPLLQWQR